MQLLKHRGLIPRTDYISYQHTYNKLSMFLKVSINVVNTGSTRIPDMYPCVDFVLGFSYNFYSDQMALLHENVNGGLINNAFVL